MLPFQLEVSELFNKFNQLQKKTKNPMAQTTQRGMPTSYVKKDGTTFQYCGSGAPVAAHKSIFAQVILCGFLRWVYT